MKRTFTLTFLLGTILIAGGCSNKIHKQKSAPPQAATAPAAAPKKDGIKAFKDIVTAKAVSKKGLFTTHKVEDKWYFEIPDSLLNREMLVVTRLSKAPSNIKVGNQQYGGESLNEQVWQWEKRGKQVYIRVPSYTTKADPNSDMYESVKNSNLAQILAAFEIKALNKDSSGVLIDVTDFYNGDVMAIGASDALRKAYKMTVIESNKSFIDTIKSFPINIEVKTSKSYRAQESPTDNSNASVTFEFNTSMLLLPKNPVKPRLMDNRVGYFGQSQVDYGSNAHKAERTAYIHRWNLVPKDTAAYMRGELVEPVNPIVIYIDPATPKKWVPFLIDGINDWQAAFEAAGFKNAVIGKAAPTPQEDPEFSVEDARYSVVRYFASNIANAYGPHVSDPRTGQILETHIGWYHNVMNLLRNWYFIQTAAINTDARKAQFTDDKMGELIRFVSSHEVGHTLGLPHNFGSSYAYPVDSLRSKSFTDKYATAPSIMDYARFNYVAQPGDGVTSLYPKIGEYDKWSVKWGYTWFPGGLSPQKEKEILNKWVKERAGNPLYYYGRQGTSIDPRLQSEDLGDDAMKASNYGIANLKRILPNLEKWTFTAGKDYSELQELYGEVVTQFNRYMGHVGTNIGGLSENFKTYDQNGAVYEYVSKAKQKEAMQFYKQQLFNTPLWLINNELLSKFDNGAFLNRIKSAQANTLSGLLSPAKIARLLDNETKNGKNSAYTLSDMFGDLSGSVFSADRPDAFKRNLQRVYIDRLENLMKKDQDLPPGFPADRAASMGLTPISVNFSDIRPLVRAELNKLKTTVRGRSAGGEAVVSAHYQDLNSRIDQILNPKKGE